MPKQYISTAEAAKILRVSRIAVFKKIQSGALKAQKSGRNYRILHQSVLEALGKEIGQTKKSSIQKAVSKAMKDYGEAFKLLGKE